MATLGTTSFVTSSDQTWAVSSTGFVTGARFNSNVFSGSLVSGTADPELYKTARTSLGSLRYIATQLQKGHYTVVLFFAEIAYLRENTLARRFFDIYLQGQLVKRDFNIRQRSRGSKCSQISSAMRNSKQQQGHSIRITNLEKEAMALCTRKGSGAHRLSNKVQYCSGNSARV